MRIEHTQLDQLVGTEVQYVAPDPLGVATFRYFALAVTDDNPRYTEIDEARRQGYEDLIAPPTLVCETNQYTGRRPDAHGYVGHSWPGIPSSAVWIRGGNDYRFERPVLPADILRVTWTLVEARDVTARDGREMIRLTSEATYHDVDGDVLAWNREIMFLADRENTGDARCTDS